MASFKFSAERQAAALAYLQGFVDRQAATPEGKGRGITRAAELLDVAQPTVTNALKPVEPSLGPKLLEALARVDQVSFDAILGWTPAAAPRADGVDATPAGRARAAAVALGFSTAAIDAGVADAVASNDTEDAWEILSRIRTKSRAPAPGRLLPSPTVQPLAANEDEPPPTVFSRPTATKPEASPATPAAKPKKAAK